MGWLKKKPKPVDTDERLSRCQLKHDSIEMYELGATTRSYLSGQSYDQKKAVYWDTHIRAKTLEPAYIPKSWVWVCGEDPNNDPFDVAEVEIHLCAEIHSLSLEMQVAPPIQSHASDSIGVNRLGSNRHGGYSF